MPLSVAEKRRVRPRNFPPPLNSAAAFYTACRRHAAGTPTQFSAAAFYTAPPLPPPRPPPRFTNYRILSSK